MKLGKKKIRDPRKPEVSIRIATAMGFAAGASLLLMNYLLFRNYSQIYALVNLLAVTIIVTVPLIYRYNSYKNVKKIEMLFPKYLTDVAEHIATGMTLPQAIKSSSSSDYGVLTPYVRALSAKIGWGISFERALKEFAISTRSKAMRRNIQTIIEAHRSGGTIDTILKSVSQTLQELEHIKKERASSVYAQMINGYMIYIIFLGVMIGLATILVPAFNSFGGTQFGAEAALSEIFMSMTIIQGFFAGLSIGKMAEGTIIAGFKHAIALVVFGYSMFLIFT